MKKFAKIMAVALVGVMAIALLVACAPASDPDKAVSALKGNGYQTAAKFTDAISLGVTETLLGAERGDLTAKVTATKIDNNKTETITIWYFKNASTANKYWDKAQSYAQDEKSDENSDWVVKKSGKMIYFGTKQAVKDAR